MLTTDIQGIQTSASRPHGQPDAIEYMFGSRQGAAALCSQLLTLQIAEHIGGQRHPLVIGASPETIPVIPPLQAWGRESRGGEKITFPDISALPIG